MTSCPVCLTTFDPAKAPGGMCPRCLMMGGAEDETPTLPSHHGIAWTADASAEMQGGEQDYQIIELIGRGGMGAVYRAWQPSLGRLVAVKVLPSEGGITGAKERFENEARVLGLLQHPNIMPVHDLGKDAEGRSFYAMKLVKGRTLQQILFDLRKGDARAVQQYSLAALLTIFEKVCDAMSFAHSQGVLHRDLKPENIMVGEFGEVLVLDWGLAKVLVGNDECQVANAEGSAPSSSDIPHSSFTDTLDGDVMGTPQYMSPEQAEGKIAEMDERSDVFSLGGVLYAILTLHPPVEGDDVKSVLQRVREGAITPPSLHGTEAARKSSNSSRGSVTPAMNANAGLPHCPGGRVPASLSAVAMKALQVDLAQRYQKVAELQAEVVAYQRGYATSAEQAGAWRQLQLLMLRHKATTGALAALLVFSVGFVIKLVQSEHAAQSSAREANEARIVALDQSEATRRALARSQISLAEAAYRVEDTQAMLAALKEVPANLRDADWRYLFSRTDNSTHRFRDKNGGYFSGVAAHPTRPGVFATVSTKSGDIVFLDAANGKIVGGSPASPRQRGTLTGEVALGFSPDGQRLVRGNPDDKGACIYDAESGKPLVEWQGAQFRNTRFSHDGARVLTASEGRVLRVHDASTGAKLWESQGMDHGVFKHDGNVIALHGGMVYLLDGTTGKEMSLLTSLNESLSSVALSSDDQVLYVGGERGGKVHAYRVSDGKKLFEHFIAEQTSNVKVSLSGDGRRLLAVADADSGTKFTRLIETLHGKTLLSMAGRQTPPMGTAIHPLSEDVLVCGGDTRSWAAAARLRERRVSSSRAASAGFWGTPDLYIELDPKLTLMAGLGTGTARPQYLPLPLPSPPPLTDRGGEWLADTSGDLAAFARSSLAGPSIFLVRRTGAELKFETTLKAGGNIAALRFSRDGQRLAVFDGAARLEVIDIATGKVSTVCAMDGFTTINVEWLGEQCLAGLVRKGRANEPDATRHLVVWDAVTGKVLRSTEAAPGVKVFACSPDGLALAVGGDDRRVRILDAVTLSTMQEFRAHDAAVTALAFHPSRPLLATASSDFTTKLWIPAESRLVQELRPSSQPVVRLRFSDNGTMLACLEVGIAHLIECDSPTIPASSKPPAAKTAEPLQPDAFEALAIGRRWRELRDRLTEVTNTAWDHDIRWVQLAAVLREMDDRASWHAFIEKRIAQASVNSHNRTVLNNVAKTCALFPHPITGEQAKTLTTLMDRLRILPLDEGRTPSEDLAVALVDLRCGRPAQAEELLKAVRGKFSGALAVSRRSVRVLANLALGNREQALAFLKSAESLAQRLGAPEEAVGENWQDRLIAWQLLEEARQASK